jgi:non-ribosomal peptide synthetase component F
LAQARPSGGYDRDSNLHDQVAQHAIARPDAIAVEFGEDRLTYGELNQLSSALALELAMLGVKKGDTVGLLLPRSLETVLAILAILRRVPHTRLSIRPIPLSTYAIWRMTAAPKQSSLTARKRQRSGRLNDGMPFPVWVLSLPAQRNVILPICPGSKAVMLPM